MKRLPPMLGRYFGSKWRSAKHYPEPLCDIIVDAFAGGAGYSLLHHTKQVVLVEKNPVVAGIWSWLINATPEEIKALPVHEPGELIHPSVQGPARDWIGFWNAFGQVRPQEKMCPSANKTYSTGRAFGSDKPGTPAKLRSCFWGANIRDRTAEAVQQIRHWRVYCGEYFDVPNIRATWFIDPPYEGLNLYGQGELSYPLLASWCMSRLGQVIVCEKADATWLPFWPLGEFHASPRARKGRRSKEGICTWVN